MSAIDPVGAGPETRTVRFAWLLFGACAAPLFWLGQLMLGYGVTAHICYPGDHPQALADGAALRMALILFDVVALAACLAGALVSWGIWRRNRDSGQSKTGSLDSGRIRFMALWGVMSSLWFFMAVLFATIASITVPPCFV